MEKKLYCMTQGAVNGRVSARQRHVKELERISHWAVWGSVGAFVLGFVMAYMWF